MTSPGWVLIAVYLIVSFVDWWAVARRYKPVEYVAKPAALIVLVGLVLSFQPTHGDARLWFIAALILSLAGDVFLMAPRDLFIFGLIAFLAGHVAYVIGFAVGGLEQDLALPLIVVSSAALAILRYLLTGARMVPQMRLPVVVYVAVISVMAGSALASGALLSATGAVLFMASDALIGWRRFVKDKAWMPVAIIALYHLGQLGIVSYLIA